MLVGTRIEELLDKINAMQAAKTDFESSTRLLKLFSAEGSEPMIVGLPGDLPFKLSINAQRQLAEWTGMRQKYWDKCWKSDPALLCHNVNTWFGLNQKTRMFRALAYEGQEPIVRAFLSKRYLRFDNSDLLAIVMPEIMKMAGYSFESSYLTYDKLWMKITFKTEIVEPIVGDPMELGVMFKNNEAGLGGLHVIPFTKQLGCLNGMALTKYGTIIRHTRMPGFGDPETWSDATMQKADAAMVAQIADAILDVLKLKWKETLIAQVKKAAGIRFDKPQAECEDILVQRKLPKKDVELCLEAFAAGADKSLYGVVNAVTYVAHTEKDDYEASTYLEEVGAAILADA